MTSPDAPAAPGRPALRPYRGEADHRAMVAVRRACAAHDGVDPGSVVDGVPTAADLARAAAHLDVPTRTRSS